MTQELRDITIMVAWAIMAIVEPVALFLWALGPVPLPAIWLVGVAAVAALTARAAILIIRRDTV